MDKMEEIEKWLGEQIKICDIQVLHEQNEFVKSNWYARKKAFEDVKRRTTDKK